MAGSKRWFSYLMDDGTSVGIQADESNIEAINGTAANDPGVNGPVRQAPKGTTLRRAVYSSADGLRKITIPVLNPTIYGALPGSLRTITNPFAGTGTGSGILTFERKRPEVTKQPKFGGDTGLTDGDVP